MSPNDLAPPLSLEQIASLLAGERPWPDTRATYAAFWMEPVDEREGEWRAVGRASTLKEAFALLGEKAAEMIREWREQAGEGDTMLDEQAALLDGNTAFLSSTDSLADSALERVSERIAGAKEPWARVLLYQLASPVLDVAPQASWSWGGVPKKKGEALSAVFLAEGGAPYDNVAFCVAEVGEKSAKRRA